jgi:tetratricopeptide (TPR) repeat protein
LRQVLLESLREIKAMEDEAAGPGELEELLPGHDGRPARVLAMRGIGAALASVGDIDSARNTWQEAIDLGSAIKRLDAKAEGLLEIATAQEAAGERMAAMMTIQQASQAARLIKEGGRNALLFRSPFSTSPLESKSSLLARIAVVQARLDDRPASERSFQQAREAAEAVEGQLEKVVALVGVASREDPTGTKPAWDRPLELALAPQEVLLRILGLEVVLRERIRAGAIQEALGVAAVDLEGVMRKHGLWIVIDELAAASNEGRTVPAPIVERLTVALKGIEFPWVFEKDQALSRLAILQARCGASGAAGATLDLLDSNDPARALQLKIVRAKVKCAIARRQLAAGNRSSARATLREALELFSGARSDEPLLIELAQLLAETGDRETALQAVTIGRSSVEQAEALAAVAAALGRANDRAGSKSALERASTLVDRIPEETAWASNSREELSYNDPRKPERMYHLGFVRKIGVLKSIAIAQAKSGDVQAAYGTLDTMLSAVTPGGFSVGGAHSEALQAIARVQAEAEDFKGAWTSCAKLQTYGLEFPNETSQLLSSVAAAQAASGDARGAMRSALAQSSEVAKLVALKGMAEGIVRRKTTRQSPKP